MMIIPVYAHFQMLRRRLMRLTGQTIACYLLQSLTSRSPRIPSLRVDVLPDTGAWSVDYINEATAAWLRSVRKECSSVTVCYGV